VNSNGSTRCALYFATFCLTSIWSSRVSAQLVDFDDLTLGATYSTGQTFVSRGVTFEVGQYNGLAGEVEVAEAIRAPGTGLEIRLEKEEQLIIHLPAGTTAVSFGYGAFCCDTGIVVNGLATPLADPDGHNFRALDGTMLGDVSINVDWTDAGGDNERGIMTLQGTITTFAVSGTFFAIDDVSITVIPEPASAIYLTLIIFSVLASSSRVRRR
jgi:hypothetical protein